MSELKPETEVQARRRRWITFGETIAVLALVVSALGLYNSWQSGRTGPAEVVEKKPAIPLVLRGEVERGGKSLALSPVEAGHALQSIVVTLPDGTSLDLGNGGDLSAGDLADALGKDIERKGAGSTRVTITTDYVEAGQERSAKRAYVLRYRWEGGGFLDDTELRFTGLTRG